MENAFAALVLFDIDAIALFDSIITPSQSPVVARNTSAAGNEVTQPSAAVSAAVINALANMERLRL